MLTQTINEDGQLVSVKDMNTTESKMDKTMGLEELRRELFEGENIVIDKTSDKGVSKINDLRTMSTMEHS